MTKGTSMPKKYIEVVDKYLKDSGIEVITIEVLGGIKITLAGNSIKVEGERFGNSYSDPDEAWKEWFKAFKNVIVGGRYKGIGWINNPELRESSGKFYVRARFKLSKRSFALAGMC